MGNLGDLTENIAIGYHSIQRTALKEVFVSGGVWTCNQQHSYIICDKLSSPLLFYNVQGLQRDEQMSSI